jgi:dipeptide/tripeptide permease
MISGKSDRQNSLPVVVVVLVYSSLRLVDLSLKNIAMISASSGSSKLLSAFVIALWLLLAITSPAYWPLT